MIRQSYFKYTTGTHTRARTRKIISLCTLSICIIFLVNMILSTQMRLGWAYKGSEIWDTGKMPQVPLIRRLCGIKSFQIKAGGVVNIVRDVRWERWPNGRAGKIWWEDRGREYKKVSSFLGGDRLRRVWYNHTGYFTASQVGTVCFLVV